MKNSIKSLSLILSFLVCFTLTMNAQSNEGVKMIQIPNAPTLNKSVQSESTVKTTSLSDLQTRLKQFKDLLKQENLSAEMRDKYQNSINILNRKIKALKIKN